MTRAALYARFSTELQSERSIDDQLALCAACAERERFTVVSRYADAARSGGSTIGRDGLAQLMEDARAGRFDVVIVEALDRLSRDMEDLAGIHKRLTFAGVAIRAVHDGEANTVLVGLRGLVGQLYREDNAEKIRRGLAGRVRDGLSGGGLPYGYAVAEGRTGERVIVKEEAAIVRRIYDDYLAGRTARAISADLNRDGVKPPRQAKRWNASTINGNLARGIGILFNEIYVGRIVWNKVRMVRHPETGKRISRPNPPERWQRADAPSLAIVTPEIFDRVQARKAALRQVPAQHQRRPKRLLSGLLRCGCCGAGMASVGRNRHGHVKLRCARYLESGDCAAPVSVRADRIERVVVDLLKSELRNPAAIAAFVKEYHEERVRLAGDSIARRSRGEARLKALDAEAERIVDMLVKGIGDVVRLDARAKEIAREEEELKAELETTPAAPNLVRLHPAAVQRYERQLEDLQRALAAGVDVGDSEAQAAIAELVESVTVNRDPSREGEYTIAIAGRLDALIGAPTMSGNRWGGTVVAGVRYIRGPLPSSALFSVSGRV